MLTRLAAATSAILACITSGGPVLASPFGLSTTAITLRPVTVTAAAPEPDGRFLVAGSAADVTDGLVIRFFG